MNLLDFIYTYFASSYTLDTLLIFYGSSGLLLVLLKFKRDSARQSSRLLVALFTVLVLNWGFLGCSLYFCNALLILYDRIGDPAATTVLGLALLTSLLIALPTSFLVTRYVPHRLVRNLTRGSTLPSRATTRMIHDIVQKLGLREITFVETLSDLPLAYAVGAAVKTVVISRGLRKLLATDEMETVLTHELAHVLKNDTRVKLLISVYRRFLFFDPFLRLIERAVEREKEFVADEFSARFTGKPLSLAAALLKISSYYADLSVASSSGSFITGETGFLRVPSVRERIVRLIRISDMMNEAL